MSKRLVDLVGDFCRKSRMFVAIENPVITYRRGISETDHQENLLTIANDTARNMAMMIKYAGGIAVEVGHLEPMHHYFRDDWVRQGKNVEACDKVLDAAQKAVFAASQIYTKVAIEYDQFSLGRAKPAFSPEFIRNRDLARHIDLNDSLFSGENQMTSLIFGLRERGIEKERRGQEKFSARYKYEPELGASTFDKYVLKAEELVKSKENLDGVIEAHIHTRLSLAKYVSDAVMHEGMTERQDSVWGAQSNMDQANMLGYARAIFPEFNNKNDGLSVAGRELEQAIMSLLVSESRVPDLSKVLPDIFKMSGP